MKKILYFLVIVILASLFLYYNDFFKEDIPSVVPLEENLKVYFIDVGEADSTLINSNNHFMLIDAGNNEDGEKLVKYLKSLGVSKLDYVILTHAHEDHVGGMDNIIRSFDIGSFYMPDVAFTSTTFKETINELENKGLKYKVPSIGDTISLGESKVKFLYVNDNEEDINSNSIVSKLTYKNTSFLFTGDTTWEVEDILKSEDIKSNVLKASHHGSNDGANYQFLKALKSEVVVISCGANNDYGHPHEKALDKFKSLGMEIYRTDLDGTIIISSNGEELSIDKIKTDTNGEEKWNM